MEKVLMKFRPTRWAYFKWYLASFMLFIAWILLSIDSMGLGNLFAGYLFLLPALAVFLIVITEIMRFYHRYSISDYRIVERNGLLSITETSLNFEKLANYTLKQNLIDRILNMGTVEIESIGGDEQCEITLKEVGNIKRIKRLVEELTLKNKRRMVK